MEQVVRWDAHEVELHARHPRSDPFWDVDVRLTLTAPDGAQRQVDAFWDGGQTWRARFKPDQPGRWRWQSSSSDATDEGLAGRAGEIECVVRDDGVASHQHGPVGIAPDAWHFAHADGTPFLWLGDTAWNGLIRSSAGDWEAYLAKRRGQGFSVVQFFSTTWRALARDPAGRVAVHEQGGFRPDPAFFRPLDARVAAIERHGMLASAIVVLALFDDEPGWRWQPEQLVRFERWLRARWDAYHVAWSLGGDGDFSGPRAARWREVGPRIASDPPAALVTLHPKGWTWIGDDFRDEPWYTFVTYQSGHADTPELVGWLPNGPPAHDWQERPPRPIVNIEPNYEDHPAHPSGIRFTDHEVRRAAWWSLFVAPTAGVSYGHYSLWAWATRPEPVGAAIRGQEDQVVQPWHTVLDTPGARSMTVLRAYLESGSWWSLRPAQQLLLAQPGERDVRQHIVVARAEDGGWTTAYTPSGGWIRIPEAARPRHGRERWFDPRDGSWRPAQVSLDGDSASFEAPDARDWLLDLRR